MPIPDYQTLMLPVLKLFADGKQNVKECIPAIKAQFDITDEEAEELIPSGSVTLLSNRVHWARTYLSKAGLLQSPKRNVHQITDLGLKVLAQNPSHIDNLFLEKFAAFTDWKAANQSDSSAAKVASKPEAILPGQDQLTPEDMITSAHKTLVSTLKDDLLALLLEMSPTRFERLIIDLLNSMGYGGGQLSESSLTKMTGDGGIDGVINEDSLGLDAVYIQAKRYSPGNNVGRPHIQQFIGSLTGESATKGVFVTTSDFSKEAKEYVYKVQQRVVLINGERLAELMIQHQVGTRIRSTFLIQDVDEDYFAQG